MAGSLSISRAWDETREIFGRDGNLLVSVALALIMLPEVLAGIIAPPQTSAMGEASGGAQLLRLAVALISLIGQLALIRLALGPSTTVGAAIGHGARRFPSALGAIALLLLGMALIVLPILLLLGVDLARLGSEPSAAAAAAILIVGILILAISVRFTLVSPVASAESAGPLTILKRSWNLTSGHYWRLLGLVALLIVVTLVLMVTASVIGGLIARMISPTIAPMSVGALVLALFAGAAQGAFSILSAAMLARVYAQVSGHGENVAEVFR